jgi:hypothetical protein
MMSFVKLHAVIILLLLLPLLPPLNRAQNIQHQTTLCYSWSFESEFKCEFVWGGIDWEIHFSWYTFVAYEWGNDWLNDATEEMNENWKSLINYNQLPLAIIVTWTGDTLSGEHWCEYLMNWGAMLIIVEIDKLQKFIWLFGSTWLP